MAYDKSSDTGGYNKDERGGWYCTNPKKHEEGNHHHQNNEPHNHRPERNESQPTRQPKHIVIPETPKTPPQKNNAKAGCGCIMLLIIGLFGMGIVINEIGKEQERYYEFDDPIIETVEIPEGDLIDEESVYEDETSLDYEASVDSLSSDVESDVTSE